MASSHSRIRAYYDGQCGMCLKGVKRLKRLDWLNRIDAIDYTGLAADDRPVPEVVFSRGMPLQTADGRLLIGFDAVRHALMHTPPGLLVGWILYLPVISDLCRRRYDTLAQSRLRQPTSPSCRP